MAQQASNFLLIQYIINTIFGNRKMVLGSVLFLC
jgi:hypothetical protein